MRLWDGILDSEGGELTPISASSFTDSRIVTWQFGFATLVEIPAESPARPAPMIMRWIDIVTFATSFDGFGSQNDDGALVNL